MSPDVYFLIAGFLFFICSVVIGYATFGAGKDGLDSEEVISSLVISFFVCICWIFSIPICIIISLGFGISYIFIRMTQKKEKIEENGLKSNPVAKAGRITI